MSDDVAIDVREALSVFEKVTRYGEKSGEVWRLDGMSADAGFDGYTVTLKDQHAAMTINFHNTFNVDCTDHKALEAFKRHLAQINSSDYEE